MRGRLTMCAKGWFGPAPGIISLDGLRALFLDKESYRGTGTTCATGATGVEG